MDGHRATRNAASSVAQTVLSALLLFGLYRYLLAEVGAASLGVWSVILASTGAARIADLGLAGSAVKFVASYLARGDEETAGAVAETTVTTIGLVIAVMAVGAYFVVGALLPAFIEPEGLEAARELLPWACVSFWLVSLAGAAQSGLEGCARFDIRNAVLLASQVVYVGLAIVLVGRVGLVGLAFAQIVQGALWFGALWLALRQRLPGLGWLPRRLRPDLVREMLSYGVSFQLLGILRMLFEPTTKALMSRYGGLEAAGLYEVASAAVLKVRSLLVAALQVVTPEVATLHERRPSRVNGVYREVDRLSWALSLPIFAGLVAGAPLLSHLLTGGFDAQVVFFVAVLSIGWLLNTVSVPAFFVLLGTGQMWHVVASHVTIGVANAALCWALGRVYGADGVVWAWALALGLGSAHLLWGLWRQRRVVSVPPLRVVAMGGAVMVAATVALWLGVTHAQSWAWALGALAGFAFASLAAVWALPERRRVTGALAGLIGR